MTAAVEFDALALQAYLRDALPELRGAMKLERIGGGQSNPTFFVSFDAGPQLVLRKQPPGELLPSAHAVDREYRVLRALAGTEVPVPPALLYCAERDVIGTPFYVMQRLHGRVYSDPSLPQLAPSQRRAYLFAMGETLARVHAVDRKSTRLNSSHTSVSRMPSSA